MIRKFIDSFFLARSSSMSEPYNRVYDVGLLDDLHNYFPALLYQHEMFTNIQDVLVYIRERTIRRFNLFDLASRQYHAANPTLNTRVQQPTAVPHLRTTTEYSSLFPILRSLSSLPVNPLLPSTPRLIPRSRRRINPFTGIGTYDDVIVHASQDIINEASTQQTLAQDLDTICTICQDNMRQGELIRKLNVCHHEFHSTCIDNWLLIDSVICPTCRHDIREPAQSATAATAATSATLTPLPTTLETPNLDALGFNPNTPPRTSQLRQRSTDRELGEILPRDIISLLFSTR